MMSEVITFQVFGIPQTKGSAKAFYRPGMRFPVVTNDNTKCKPWATTIKLVAQEHAPHGGPWEGPVRLGLMFLLPRPKTLPKKIVHHLKKPDLDKLTRAVKDALTAVIYRDDSQVIEAHLTKQYDATPSVVVTIEQIG